MRYLVDVSDLDIAEFENVVAKFKSIGYKFCEYYQAKGNKEFPFMGIDERRSFVLGWSNKPGSHEFNKQTSLNEFFSKYNKDTTENEDKF